MKNNCLDRRKYKRKFMREKIEKGQLCFQKIP